MSIQNDIPNCDISPVCLYKMTFLIVINNVQKCDENIVQEIFVEINTETYGTA